MRYHPYHFTYYFSVHLITELTFINPKSVDFSELLESTIQGITISEPTIQTNNLMTRMMPLT